MAKKRAEVVRMARRRYWRSSDAKVVVDAWRSSGEPMAQFARSYGVDRGRLARWAKRLVEQPATGELQFHPVRLVAAGQASPEPIEIAIMMMMLEVRRRAPAPGMTRSAVTRMTPTSFMLATTVTAIRTSNPK